MRFGGFDKSADAMLPAFALADLIRFIAVDLIINLAVNIMDGSAVFSSIADRRVALLLGKLGGKLILAGYMVWLIRNRRNALEDLGLSTAGRAPGWIAGIALYVPVWYGMLSLGGYGHQFLGWLYGLFGLPYRPEPQDLFNYLFDPGLGLPYRLALGFFAVAAGPVMEEIAFRGMGMASFSREGRRFAGIIITSILFGIYHLQATSLPALTFFGAFLAVIRLYSKSLYPCFLMHIAHNIVVIYLLFRVIS